jgi:multiple sugar transport system ATP-binding protein
MAVVELEHITKTYPGGSTPAVDDVTLKIDHGEFMVLLGPSGCGKSTTLRMVAGLESITSGTLRIDGEIMNTVPARDRDIAMVFQSYALYPHMTVRKNLAFGLRRRRVTGPEIKRRVEATAGMLGLSELLDRKPFALSGGQRQRVALGRAIVRDPKVFLFDEPLSNLDATLRVHTRNELIKQYQRLGATMIYVTHDQVEAMTMGSRVCVMNHARVVQVGRPLEVYRDPADTFVASFIGSPPTNLIEAEVVSGSDGLAVRFGDAQMPVPGYTENDLARLSGREVIFGIRPEDMYLARPPGSTDGRYEALRAEVVSVEPLGAETLLVLNAPGEGRDIIARLGRETTARTGQALDVHLDLTAMHLFDPTTTRKLPRSGAAEHGDRVVNAG